MTRKQTSDEVRVDSPGTSALDGVTNHLRQAESLWNSRVSSVRLYDTDGTVLESGALHRLARLTAHPWFAALVATISVMLSAIGCQSSSEVSTGPSPVKC